MESPEHGTSGLPKIHEHKCSMLIFVYYFTACGSLVCGVEQYSLSYNYFDEIAQSYCAGSHKFWTFAVRRDCSVAPTCNDICKNAAKNILSQIGNQRDKVACYDAFHIQKGHPVLRANPGHAQPDAGLVNMGTYGYGAGGCTWKPNHCGPNYCCCKAY